MPARFPGKVHTFQFDFSSFIKVLTGCAASRSDYRSHASYGCTICCGPTDPYMEWDPLSLLPGGFWNQQIQSGDSCTRRLTTITSDFPTWWTDNNAIATASTNKINGIAVGATGHHGLSNSIYWGPLEDSGGEPCPLDQQQVDAGTNVGPVPVNFTLDSAVDAGGGDLHLVWTWQSSSGNLSDLSSCSVGENVSFPGAPADYTWQTPFPLITIHPNPTTGSVPATDGSDPDDHDLLGKLDTDFRKPYSANSFVAQQSFSYSCVYNGKTLTGTLFATANVTRVVKQNTNGSWYFKVDEPIEGTDYSATINPLP